MERLPFEPLKRYYGPVVTRRGSFHNTTTDAHVRALAEIAGVSHRQVHRWRHDGLSIFRADQVAVALGAHPSEIWPEWFAHA